MKRPSNSSLVPALHLTSIVNPVIDQIPWISIKASQCRKQAIISRNALPASSVERSSQGPGCQVPVWPDLTCVRIRRIASVTPFICDLDGPLVQDSFLAIVVSLIGDVPGRHLGLSPIRGFRCHASKRNLIVAVSLRAVYSAHQRIILALGVSITSPGAQPAIAT